MFPNAREVAMANQVHQRLGIVVALLTEEQSKTISSIVSTGISHPELFVIPRYIYTKEHILANYGENLSKNQLLKHQELHDTGEEIYFTLKEPGSNVIIKCQREIKSIKRYESHPSLTDNLSSEFYYHCVISDERVRRFHSDSFADGNLVVPNHVLQEHLPNVPYYFGLRVTVDLGQYKADQPPEECHPTLNIKFGGIAFPSPKLWKDLEAAKLLVSEAPWNRNRHFPAFDPLYPRTIFPWCKEKEFVQSACLILNEMEVYCRDRPNEKCRVAFINHGDFLFMEGRTIWGELYYCRYNEAYILYRYIMDFWPDPEKHPEEFTEYGLAHLDPLHCSEENPMETRIKNGATEFLAYLKLNRLNHFFSCYAIHLIVDPKNVSHGRFQLGEQEHPDYEREQKQMLGQRAWLRYFPNKRGIKWEISEMFDEKGKEGKAVEHKPFISLGLKLNRIEGLVYCPSICNFPLRLSGDLRKCAEIDVGDWFRFEGKFNVDWQCYEIFRIVEVVTPGKYPVMRLAEGPDDFAFKVRLHENYQYARNLLMSEEFGFVEDVETKITMFICKWAETHNDPYVDVWCCYNPDLDTRVTPMRVIDIAEPPNGILYVRQPANGQSTSTVADK